MWVCVRACVRSSGPKQHLFYVTSFVTLILFPSKAILQTPLRRFLIPHLLLLLLLLLLGAVDHLVPLNHSLISLLVSIYRKSRYLEVDAALALCSDCPASTPANASPRQEALDGVAGAAPSTRSVRPSPLPPQWQQRQQRRRHQRRLLSPWLEPLPRWYQRHRRRPLTQTYLSEGGV